MGETSSTFHCALLEYAPSGESFEIGTLVWDDARERVSIVLCHGWRSIVLPEDIEYFEALIETLNQITSEKTASVCIQFFEASLSNVLRMGDPTSIVARTMDAAAHLALNRAVETNRIAGSDDKAGSGN